MVLNWQADFKTWSADRVERAYTDDYELVVLEFSATRGHRLIIWGIYTGRWFVDQIATGESMTLDQAKVAAEATLADIVNRAKEQAQKLRSSVLSPDGLGNPSRPSK
jgi:hypothetical protein